MAALSESVLVAKWAVRLAELTALLSAAPLVGMWGQLSA